MEMIKDNQQQPHNKRLNRVDRRKRLDPRKTIRFDKIGGDRRSGSGRRSSDERLEVLD